ncbi:MAG: hypothetical protein Q9221_000574 [Calogaya cf. arnoldii]
MTHQPAATTQPWYSSLSPTEMDHLLDEITKVLPKYWSQRKKLVRNTVKMLEEKAIVVIRASPQSGKSMFLGSVAPEILANHPHLEPVAIRWEKNTSDHDYNSVLEKAKAGAKVQNQEVREILQKDPHKFTRHRKPVCLIDNAENCYLNFAFWDKKLRDSPAYGVTPQEYFLLFCSHGPSDGYFAYGDSQWQAADIPSDRRIELLPLDDGGLQLLLDAEETKELVDHWAKRQDPKAKCDDSVYEFVQTQTQGHFGVTHTLLDYVSRIIKHRVALLVDTIQGFQLTCNKDHDVPSDHYYDAQRFCQILARGFMQSLENSDSGMFWNREQEEQVRSFRLRELKPSTTLAQFTDLRIEDIRDAMGKVAREPKGYLVEEDSEPRSMQVTLQACHHLGLLFSKQQGSVKILYVFPSPIHQRYDPILRLRFLTDEL